jgi:hypothetical protein
MDRAEHLIQLLDRAGSPGAFTEYFLDEVDGDQLLLRFVVPSRDSDVGDAEIVLWVTAGQWQIDSEGGPMGPVAELDDNTLVAAFTRAIEDFRFTLG